MKALQITEKTRKQLYVRAGGMCERCGGTDRLQAHHRCPRKRGGTRRPEIATGLANLVLICGDCHAHIENEREWAYKHGWLVHDSHTPAEQPVRGFRSYNYPGRITALLADDGGITAVWDDNDQIPA